MIDKEYLSKKIPPELHTTEEFNGLLRIIKENIFDSVRSLYDFLDKECERCKIELDRAKRTNASGSGTIKMRECAIRIGSFKRCKGLIEDFLL